MPRRITYDFVKRGLDIISASVGLVLAAPLMGVVALLVRRDVGSPVIFKQERPGLHGQVFTLYKFRTMTHVNHEHEQVDDVERLTRFGELLRSTSVDELPSLLNVLKGEMSMVGPRPLLVEYLDKYTLVQARRHEVRPGITGLAQVSGRNGLAWEHRFDLDIQYVDGCSPALDAKILLLTAGTVIRRSGISHGGHATMYKFGGAK